MKLSKGFTLIELLVIVAIIGVLSTIVLSSLNAARERAQKARALSFIRQIQTALENYYLDHGYYPDDGTDNGAAYLSRADDFTRLALLPYIDTSYEESEYSLLHVERIGVQFDLYYRPSLSGTVCANNQRVPEGQAYLIYFFTDLGENFGNFKSIDFTSFSVRCVFPPGVVG